MLPASTRSAVVLPAPDGPTMPTNSPRWIAQVDVDEDRVTRVAAGDARQRRAAPRGRRRSAGRGHCGYVAVSGATSPGVERLQRARVAAHRLGHRHVVEVHEAHPRVLGVAGRRPAGRRRAARRRTRRRPPCRSARAPGSGRPPSRRSRGPSSLRTWSISAATSFGVGSSKSRDLDRADDVPAVVAREVRVGVVVGQQLALRARDRRERRAHGLVERVDLRLEPVVVGGEVARRCRRRARRACRG